MGDPDLSHFMGSPKRKNVRNATFLPVLPQPHAGTNGVQRYGTTKVLLAYNTYDLTDPSSYGNSCTELKGHPRVATSVQNTVHARAAVPQRPLQLPLPPTIPKDKKQKYNSSSLRR